MQRRSARYRTRGKSLEMRLLDGATTLSVITGFAVALVSGCGGAPPAAISSNGYAGLPSATDSRRDVQSKARTLKPLEARGPSSRPLSWVAPGAASQSLLYVTDVRVVAIYSYPKGKLEGTLRGFYIAAGACVDMVGDVFIVDLGYNKIFEYAHGGTKRLKALQSASSAPNGCALDPTTGNLAVASLGNGSNGSVAIYENASGTPTTYKNAAFREYWLCGYDDKGNLFVDGQDSKSRFVFAELPKGGSSLETVTLDQGIGWPGGIQWDGAYLALGDQNSPVIYQFSIEGSQGTRVGATTMQAPMMSISSLSTGEG